MFERTPSRAEIDFVGPDLGVPFESKYVDGPWRRATRTLKAKGRGGIVATRTVLELEDRGAESPVWAVPAGILGWLLTDRGAKPRIEFQTHDMGIGIDVRNIGEAIETLERDDGPIAP